MRFFRRAAVAPRSLGVLPAAFHPPTLAHVALAQAALDFTDEVLCVLPGIFPHEKDYRVVTLEDRVRMLEGALGGEPRFSIAVTEGGLFIEIARECRAAYRPDVQLKFICGRDAAERIVNWDYGRPGAFREMLEEFELLVAPRGGAYDPPPELRHRIHSIGIPEECEAISGTEARRRIARGAPWEFLVPEAIVPLVRELYGATPATGARG